MHALLNTIFDGSIPSHTQWRVFLPEYLTLIVSYGLLHTRWLKLATHVFLLGMIITQMSVIFFMTGPMSYIYVSYTNVVLIAGLILGPVSAALYTGTIIGLMYLYFNAIRTGRLDMMLLSQSPYGAEMQMVATQACFIFTGLTVSYFIVRQSRLHQQMVKEQERTERTLRELQQAETLNTIQAKQDATIGWMKQFIQTEYPQSFFETTLPKVFDTIDIELLLIKCPINHPVLSSPKISLRDMSAFNSSESITSRKPSSQMILIQYAMSWHNTQPYPLHPSSRSIKTLHLINLTKPAHL